MNKFLGTFKFLQKEKTPEKNTKKITRKTLKELVKGKNQIGNVTFEVIEPLPIDYTIIKEGEVEEGGEGRIVEIYRVDPNIKVEIEFKIDLDGSWGNSFTIYQGDEKINSYKPDWGYNGMMGSEGTVSIFKYSDKKYILISGSICGMKFCQVSYYWYVLDENGNLEGPLFLEETESTGSPIGGDLDLFIGYQNSFYIISLRLDRYVSGCPGCYSPCNYDGRDKITVRSIGKDNILKDTLIGSGVELIESKGKLYFDMKDNYCYHYYISEKNTCSGLPSRLFSACVSNYYLLTEDGKFKKMNEEFKEEYLKEAIKSNSFLNGKEWIKEMDKLNLPSKEIRPEGIFDKNWPAILVKKTLNYIFANMEKQAWQEFERDFKKFSNEYPLKEEILVAVDKYPHELTRRIKIKVDPEIIKKEIQGSFF